MNYRTPPKNTNNIPEMLKYFGCSLNADRTVSVFDKNRLPKLSCPKTNNPLANIIVSFPGPTGYGLQSFAFSPESLISAYNSYSKYGIPFSTSLPNLHPFVNFILSYFIFNPTLIKRVYYHKRGQFKLPLLPSTQKIERA